MDRPHRRADPAPQVGDRPARVVFFMFFFFNNFFKFLNLFLNLFLVLSLFGFSSLFWLLLLSIFLV